jgi:hypothetical protein
MYIICKTQCWWDWGTGTLAHHRYRLRWHSSYENSTEVPQKIKKRTPTMWESFCQVQLQKNWSQDL